MPNARDEALATLKTVLLKDAQQDEEPQIEAVMFLIGDGLASLARIAAALEKPTAIERVGEVGRETRRG